MNRARYFFPIYLFLFTSNVYAKKYILKSQNIFFKDDETNLNVDREFNLDVVIKEIEKFRMNLYELGDLKKKKYKTFIALMKKFYSNEIKTVDDIKKKKFLLTEYQRNLDKILKNQNSKNFFQIIGIPNVIIDPKESNIKSDIKDQFFQDGYLDVKIKERYHIKGKYLFLKYYINKRNRYKINSYVYDDIEMLKNYKGHSIKEGDYYTLKNISEERIYLYEHLKKSGFLFFDINYINFYITKNEDKNNVDICLKFDPTDHYGLKKFNIDKIYIKLDEDGNDQKQIQYSIDDVIFVNISNINKQRIYDKIFFKKGNLYSSTDEQKTFKKLIDSNIFTNVNINHQVNDGNLETTITLLKKKKIDHSLDFGFITGNRIKDNTIISPYLSQDFTIRNFLRLLETISINFYLFNDIGYDKKFFIYPYIKSKLSFSFPYLISPFFLKDSKNYDIQTEVSTNIKLNINDNQFFFKNLETEEKEIKLRYIQTFIAYRFNNSKYSHNIIFFPIKVNIYKNIEEMRIENLIYTKIQLDNKIYTDKGNKSFVHNVFDYSRSRKKNNDYWIKHQYLKNVLEVKQTFSINANLEFINRSKFGLLYIFKSKRDKTLENIPSNIYFTAGGHGSIRGFELNSVGPGKNHMVSKNKKSELLFVVNNELRKKITKVVEGAFFIDLGNTWRINTDNENEKFNLLNLFIGYGFGIRFNFNFIVLTFDFGFPMHSPGRKFSADDVQFYFSLNYPF